MVNKFEEFHSYEQGDAQGMSNGRRRKRMKIIFNISPRNLRASKRKAHNSLSNEATQ